MEPIIAFRNHLQAQKNRHEKRYRIPDLTPQQSEEAWEGLNATWCMVHAFNQYFPEHKITRENQ